MKDALAVMGVCLLMHYAAAAFVFWEPHPGNWSELVRLTVAWVWVACSFLVVWWRRVNKT